MLQFSRLSKANPRERARRFARGPRLPASNRPSRVSGFNPEVTLSYAFSPGERKSDLKRMKAKAGK
jgi:hypothetical protein